MDTANECHLQLKCHAVQQQHYGDGYTQLPDFGFGAPMTTTFNISLSAMNHAKKKNACLEILDREEEFQWNAFQQKLLQKSTVKNYERDSKCGNTYANGITMERAGRFRFVAAHEPPIVFM